jgi:hypothetical protein
VWKTVKEAFQGVSQNEIDNHKKIDGGCYRCGRPGHRTTDCYAQQTIEGTTLPVGKASAVVGGTMKRKNDETPAEAPPASKQAKIAAAATYDDEIREAPIWIQNESDESDF